MQGPYASIRHVRHNPVASTKFIPCTRMDRYSTTEYHGNNPTSRALIAYSLPEVSI